MTPSLSSEVFEALHELLHLFRHRLMAASQAASPDLTFGELRILMKAGRHPGLTQKALVAHSHADKAQIARTLAQLQDKGWLLRSASERDRRMRCLYLSEQGQALFDQLQAQREQIAGELLRDVPEPLQAQLLQLLNQARRSAGET
jgi:DNA-binding MarR family transcriptional regulator